VLPDQAGALHPLPGGHHGGGDRPPLPQQHHPTEKIGGHQLDHVAPFSGDKTLLRDFLFDLELYFAHYTELGDVARVRYAATRMRGEAKAWMQGTIKDCLTYPALVMALKVAFTDSTTVARAQRALQTVTQGTGTVGDLIRHFRTLLQDATWDDRQDDQVIINLFVAALDPSIRSKLLFPREPLTTMQATMAEAQRTEDIFNAMKAYEPGPGPAPATPAAPRGPTPMHLDAATGVVVRHTRLTPEARLDCQSKGLCFRCRQPGHRANECPLNTGGSARTMSQSRSLHFSGVGINTDPHGYVRSPHTSPTQGPQGQRPPALTPTLSANLPQLHLPVTLTTPQGVRIPTVAMVDSGSTSCFIAEELVETHGIRTVEKAQPLEVLGFDGRPVGGGEKGDR
jgi:hypothetical protein